MAFSRRSRRFHALRGALKLPGEPLQLCRGQLGREPLARSRPRGGDGRAHFTQRNRRVLSFSVEFADDQRQDVQFPHDAQPSRDSLQPAGEVTSLVSIEPRERQHLPQPPRRNPCVVQHDGVAVVNPVQVSQERTDAPPEDGVSLS